MIYDEDDSSGRRLPGLRKESHDMKELFSIPYDNYMIDHYGGAEGLEAMVKAAGCDGIEWVWGGEPVTREMPKNIVNGYHLTFFNDWLDYYLGNTAAVEERFGHNGK